MKVQSEEHRSHSELFATYTPTKIELAAIRKGRAEFKRGEYVTLNELHDELAAARHQKRKKRTRKTA